MSDYDDACWAQQESEERARREEEALARHRVLLEQSRTESAEFARHCADWRKRTTAQAVNERKVKCL